MIKVKLLTLVSVFSLLSYESGGMNVRRYGTGTSSVQGSTVKTTFSKQEDQRIYQFIQQHGRNTNWVECAKFVGGGRTARQCRERWKNCLTPAESSNAWSPNEDQILMKKYFELGNRWSKIAAFLPGRSDTAVKNRWSKLNKRGGNAFFSLLQIEDEINDIRARIHDVAFQILRQPSTTEENQNAQNHNPTNPLRISNDINANLDDYYPQPNYEYGFLENDLFKIQNDSDQNFEPSIEQGTDGN